MSAVPTCVTDMAAVLTQSCTKWCVTSMCFVRLKLVGLYIIVIAPWLSQCISTGWSSPPSSRTNRHSQRASLAAMPAATYSASVVEAATVTWILLPHEKSAPPQRKACPVLDHRVSISPA